MSKKKNKVILGSHFFFLIRHVSTQNIQYLTIYYLSDASCVHKTLKAAYIHIKARATKWFIYSEKSWEEKNDTK